MASQQSVLVQLLGIYSIVTPCHSLHVTVTIRHAGIE